MGGFRSCTSKSRKKKVNKTSSPVTQMKCTWCVWLVKTPAGEKGRALCVWAGVSVSPGDPASLDSPSPPPAPLGEEKKRRRSVKHKYFRWGRTMKSISGKKKSENGKWIGWSHTLHTEDAHLMSCNDGAPEERESCVYIQIFYIKWYESNRMSSRLRSLGSVLQKVK